MAKRAGHVAGSSARYVVVASVKSTLGETVFQPRSMPPRTVADIASIACPCSLAGVGAGQVNDPVSWSRPSMRLRLSTIRPVEETPSSSRTEPRTVAWLRLSEYAPGLCSSHSSANRLPSVALRKLTRPPSARRPSR